jgi:Mn-dependent DtxR family transcriptional regulator
LTLFDLVGREGPATSPTLARRLEQNQARLEEDLRELDALGFFERTIGGDGEVRWALHGGVVRDEEE